MKKSVSYWFLRTIVRVGMLKKNTNISKNGTKKTLIFHSKSSQNGREKQIKMSWQQKLAKRRLLGRTFVKKKTKFRVFLVFFSRPTLGENPKETLGGNPKKTSPRKP